LARYVALAASRQCKDVMKPARGRGSRSLVYNVKVDGRLKRQPACAAARFAHAHRPKASRCFPVAAILSAWPSKLSGLTCLYPLGKILLAIFSGVTPGRLQANGLADACDGIPK